MHLIYELKMHVSMQFLSVTDFSVTGFGLLALNSVTNVKLCVCFLRYHFWP